MEKNIAVIGIGNLGMRHMQSLLEMKDYHVVGMDSNADQIQKSKQILCEDITAFTRITDLPVEIELAVIATSSNVRRQVFEELVSHAHVKNIIFEKVLFQKQEDYYSVSKILKDNSIKAWVNCARREYKDYQKLCQILQNERLDFYMSGAEWGLGCNCIHMLDLFSFLCGSNDIMIRNVNIEKDITSSKRKGFYEIYGNLSGVSSNGDTFFVGCRRNSNLPSEIRLETDTQRIVINESKRKMVVSSKENDWNEEEFPFEILYQSQLTATVAKEILEGDGCKLPTYEESASLHLKFIDAINPVFAAAGFEEGLCPIT